MQAASVLSALMMRGRVLPCTQPAGREGGRRASGFLCLDEDLLRKTFLTF